MALSAFGLCSTMLNIFFNGSFFGFEEVLGSYVSRGYGMKNFKMMGQSLYQVSKIIFYNFLSLLY
jgi:hypothetical protein